jgi:hypothetical protein
VRLRGLLQTIEYKLLASLNALNVVQSLIIFSGLAAGLTVCAKASDCSMQRLPMQGGSFSWYNCAKCPLLL